MPVAQCHLGGEDRRASDRDLGRAVSVAGDATGVHAETQRLARRARRLSWASLAWLGIEGGLGVASGALAGSVALVAFGLDSGIEGLASVVVIWRFTSGRASSESAERRAQKLVGVSFLMLAPYVAVEAARALATGRAASTSWVGIGLAAGSLAICPWLGRAKRQIGDRLGSAATSGEGRQNQLCALLAAGVLVGLGAEATIGWWWFDPVAALAIAAACLVEGRRSWRGEACACSQCAPAITDQGRAPAAVGKLAPGGRDGGRDTADRRPHG